MNLGNIAILGGGFGLYGYLPALSLVSKKPIYTLSKYEEIIDNRKELSVLNDKIVYLKNDDECLKKAKTLVIARRPVDQEHLLNVIIKKRYSIKNFLVEKPLSTNPFKANQLLVMLKNLSAKLRIGYIFNHTQWYKSLKKKIEKNDLKKLKIIWRFKAHHYKYNLKNWKSNVQEGGGALRFFGIHLISVVASLENCRFKYCDINPVFFKNEIKSFQILLMNDNNITFELICDSRYDGSEEFKVFYTDVNGFEKSFYNLSSPFELEIKNKSSLSGFDIRVQLLKDIILSLENNDKYFWDYYSRTIDIWKECESKII